MQLKRKQASFVLLALELYALLTAGLYLIFSESTFLSVLSPLTILAQFTGNWFEPAPVVLAICCVPLIGWLLLYKNCTVGLYLIRLTHIVALWAGFAVTAMHVIIDLGGLRSLTSLGYTLVYCAVCLVHSVLCLVFLSRWKPNTKF